jgi:broad specificity phosphatase PhoE
MTMFYLVRHGAHGLVDRVLVGRMPGVSLSEAGREQARRIASILSGERITALQSSPQPRAQETAHPMAERLGLPIQIASAIDELDAGTWTGQPFAALTNDPLWRLWNHSRGTARPPKGESMLELQTRAMAHVNSIAAAAPEGRVAMVSHAEVIRAIIMNVLRMPLDEFHRVEIVPGSVSTVAIEGGNATIVSLNQPVTTRSTLP